MSMLLPRWPHRRLPGREQNPADGERDGPQAHRATTFDADMLAQLPTGPRDQLPHLPPAVLFTAYALANHGNSAPNLTRRLGLSASDACTIAVYARDPSHPTPQPTNW